MPQVVIVPTRPVGSGNYYPGIGGAVWQAVEALNQPGPPVPPMYWTVAPGCVVGASVIAVNILLGGWAPYPCYFTCAAWQMAIPQVPPQQIVSYNFDMVDPQSLTYGRVKELVLAAPLPAPISQITPLIRVPPE